MIKKSQKLKFEPFFGFTSKHLQMIIAAFLPGGKAPLSTEMLVDIGNGDQLSCQVSIPTKWKVNDKTIVLIHGLGGSHDSRYMVRMSRKLYDKDYKVVRVNLRGSGTGKGLSKLPYNAGNSQDVLKVLQVLKKSVPSSDIVIIGFSLGGNTALKLAGELGQAAPNLIKSVIAVCPPFDLEYTVLTMKKKKYQLYQKYYLKGIFKQALPWTTEKFKSVYDYDEKITGPLWGYTGAKDYYLKNSSMHFLNRISVNTDILCAEDDPFVSINALKDLSPSDYVHLWTTDHGSHMGFLGRKNFQWVDTLLLNWIEEKKEF